MNTPQDLSDFAITNAVILKFQNGKIIHQDSPNNAFQLVIAKSDFGILNWESSPSTADLFYFINWLKGHKSELPQYFHLYDPTIELKPMLEKDEDIGIRYRERILLRCKEVPDENPEENQSIVVINRTNFELVWSTFEGMSVFWSKEEFIEHGVGVVAMQNQNPIGICYTAANDGKVGEVDILTNESHRGKGFGKLMAQAFIKECEKHGISAGWDCFTENIASLNTALSTGFKEKRKYHLLSIYLKD